MILTNNVLIIPKYL